MTYFVKRRSLLVGKAEMSDGIRFTNDEVRR
jgi:hypothetical protein